MVTRGGQSCKGPSPVTGRPGCQESQICWSTAEAKGHMKGRNRYDNPRMNKTWESERICIQYEGSVNVWMQMTASFEPLLWTLIDHGGSDAATKTGNACLPESYSPCAHPFQLETPPACECENIVPVTREKNDHWSWLLHFGFRWVGAPGRDAFVSIKVETR